MGVHLPVPRYIATIKIMNDDVNTTIDLEREGLQLLRENMADKLVKEKVEKIYKSHHTEFRLELYVFIPDELSKIIHDRAMELARVLYKGGA